MKLPTIYLDMDGTIADLYSVPNWLPMLEEEDSTPYRKARLLLDEAKIKYLQNYIAAGGSVGIISWLSKGASRSYDVRVRAAKVLWLKKHLPLPYATIHIVKYGTPKSKFGENGDILLDDEAQNLLDYKASGNRNAFHPNQFWDMAEYINKKYFNK